MSNKRYPTFARFMDGYWNQDGPFLYGNLLSALREFFDLENPADSIKLIEEIRSLRNKKAFLRSRHSRPYYENLMSRRFDSVIYFDEIEEVHNTLDDFSRAREI